MFTGRTLFAQLMDLLPLPEFRKCVARYRGEHKVLRFSCLDQFLALAFAQLTGRESLRDIEACLRAMQPRLYHMGFRGLMARNTLAHANERRDWRIYADLAQVLIQRARPLYANEDFGAELEQTAYAFDSTTIDLCLELFPWAHFRRHKGAIGPSVVSLQLAAAQRVPGPSGIRCVQSAPRNPRPRRTEALIGLQTLGCRARGLRARSFLIEQLT